MEIYLLREAALPDVAAQRSKNQGSSQESGGTCERNEPRDVACRYRTNPLTAAFAGLHFCVQRAGNWLAQQERQNNRRNFCWPVGFGIRRRLRERECWQR